MGVFPYAVLDNKLVVRKSEVIFFQSKHILLLEETRKYDNHNMALMLIEMLYEKGMVNEATYRTIMSKNRIQNRIA